MKKEFLTYEKVRNNALKLAARIYKSNFIPDVIYVSLRGGAYMGNVISEYFKLASRKSHPVYYAAVVARSYVNVGTQEDVKVEGWTYNPEYLRQGDKVLIVDDIFDTGRTMNHLVKIVMEKSIPRSDIKVVVHDYKIRKYLTEQHPVQPDFYCRLHEINSEAEDSWIHYESHELVGLTLKEREEHYYAQDPDLRNALEFLYNVEHEQE